MKYIEMLDKVIMSDDVSYSFYNLYDNNEEFREWLDNILPEIRKCELQKQNNPWHKYNVLGHILHAVEAMNSLTKNMDYKTRRLLAYVMLFHDIGKPDVVTINPKTGYDRFINHNKQSAKIANRLLDTLHFNDSEKKLILDFIIRHDLFMFLTMNKTTNPYKKELTDKVVDELIQELNVHGDGKKILSWLLLVGRSDNLAQNELMTEESFKLLDKFESMLGNKRDERRITK